MSEPRTKAGKALLGWFGGPMRDRDGLVERILAIEAEASQPVLREAHDFQLVPENRSGSAYIFCPRCGATRWLRAAGEPVNEPCRAALAHPTSSPEDKE